MKLLSRAYGADTETTGIRYWHGDRAFASSVSDEDGATFFWRGHVDPYTRQVYMTTKDYTLLEPQRRILESEKVAKVFHNAKFDIRMYKALGIEVMGKIHDTRVAMHCLRTAEPGGLKFLAKKYLGISDQDQRELERSTIQGRRIAKKKGWRIAEYKNHGDNNVHADYWLAEPSLLEAYSRMDPVRTIGLWMFVEPLLKEEGLWEVYEEEMRTLFRTIRMENWGIRVDLPLLESEIVETRRWMKKSLRSIHAIKPGINVNSHAQLSKYVYDDLGNEVVERTDKGNPSVGYEALQKIKHPIVQKIFEYKAAQKNYTNFLINFRKEIVWDEEQRVWLLHPDFNPVGTVTSRYSCNDPNLQNVARGVKVRAPVAIQARTALGPRPGYVWLHFDFGAMEAWVFAGVSRDKQVLEILASGRDLMTEIANQVFGDGADIVSKEASDPKFSPSRIKAKMLFYGIIYGGGPEALAPVLSVSEVEASTVIAKYKAAFPGVDRYMVETSETAKRTGFVTGPLGRKWQIDPSYAYVSVNYIVQGTSAQIIKMGIKDAEEIAGEIGIEAHVAATVHDENIVEVKADSPYLRKYAVALKKKMESYGELLGLPKLPVKIEITRSRWSEVEEY